MSLDSQDEWKAFEEMKELIEIENRAKGLSLVRDDMGAEVVFWRETCFVQYVQSNRFSFDLDAMREDRFRYLDRIASMHTCTAQCTFRHLQRGFNFRMSDGNTYEATGLVYVCSQTMKAHFCGENNCNAQTLPTNAECTVCALTGRLISENKHMSLARSREEPDVRVAGDFAYQQYFPSGNDEGSVKSEEPVNSLVVISGTVSNRYDYRHCLNLLKNDVSHDKVLQIAQNRAAWRKIASEIYEEQVMCSRYVEHQEQAIKDAHRVFMENADRYVQRCAKKGKPYDIVHIQFLFNQYEKPTYRGVYFTADVDRIKIELKETVTNIMLDVWEKISKSPGARRDNFSFNVCARGILAIAAGHSVDHENGLRIQLKVDRKSGEPSRITEYDGVQSVDLSRYEIREFNFIPRVEGLVLAPASIVNQEKSNKKKKAGAKRGSSSRLIVSSNTRSKKGVGVPRKSTGSNRNEGRMPSVKNVHSIITEIIETSKTSSDIEQYCYV